MPTGSLSGEIFLASALACVGTALGPAPAAALPRQMVRDFPVSYCPVHTGRSVDANGNLLPASPVRVRPEVSFTATGASMSVTFSTCSNGSVLQPNASIGFDNFTLVRSSFYVADANQVDRSTVTGRPFDEQDCYTTQGGGFANTVGTVFNPALEPACGPANADCPFRDGFEGGVTWTFSGGAGVVVDGNSNHELVLPSSASCSSATATLANLVAGESYVLDYDWRADQMVSTLPLVTVDVTSPASLLFTVPPCRLVDTRNPDGPLGGPALVAGADRTFALTGHCGIPATAGAVAVNVSVTAATAQGNLRLYPAGTPLPTVATLNYDAGKTTGNGAIVPLGAGGAIAVRCAQPSGTTHFILDVTGYFE